MKRGGGPAVAANPGFVSSIASLPEDPPKRRRADRFLREGLTPLFLALAIFWASPPLGAQPVQLLSVRKYYTLSLSPGTDGRQEPLLREIFLSRFRNFGPTFVNQVYHDEIPQQPYLEYRESIEGSRIPVRKIGSIYWTSVRYPARREIELRTDALQRVLPRDPGKKIDFFEDSIEWSGWRPPIEDYWIVVDLGKMYASFRQIPALGMGGAPPPSFPEFFAGQVIRVLPAGYRIQGSTVWWHFRQIYAPQGNTTLHVEWKAWYR